jgi:hypothetical protein
LVRATAGTAIVAGTAGAVHHHQAKKWAKQDQQEYEAQQYEQQQYAQQQAAQEPEYYEEPAPAPAPPPPAAATGPDLTAQLQQLAQLHESGVLSDEEFAAAKAKLLGG